MKLRILLLTLLSLVMATTAYGRTATAIANMAYNGVNKTGGFTIERQDPGATEWVLEVDLPEALMRKAQWTFEVMEGRTMFRTRAYSGDMFSEYAYSAFEYIDIPGLPAPTVILNFTTRP